MSPEAANICIIDDMPVAIDGIKNIFETSDHKVVLVATNPKEGLKAVDKFKELKIQVVLLDTKLIRGDSEGVESRKILNKIRKIAPQVKVISVSTGTPLKGADLRLTRNFNREELINHVNNI